MSDLICDFSVKAQEAGVYAFSKDFIVPSLAIIASVAAAYFAAFFQIKGQKTLKKAEERNQRKQLLNVVKIQNELLIKELNARSNEINDLKNKIRKEEITSEINEVYLPSLTRLSEIDYKDLHDVFFNLPDQKGEILRTFLLFHNSLIHLEKNVININNSGKIYYKQSNENFERLKSLFVSLKFQIGELFKIKNVSDASLLVSFEQKFSSEGTFEKYFEHNVKLVNELYTDLLKNISIKDLNLLRIVTEIRNIAIQQNIVVSRYEGDLDFYLKNVTKNEIHLVKMEAYLA